MSFLLNDSISHNVVNVLQRVVVEFIIAEWRSKGHHIKFFSYKWCSMLLLSKTIYAICIITFAETYIS